MSTPARPAAPAGLRRRALLAAASVAALLALLGALEAVARLASPAPPEQRSEQEFIARSLEYLEPCYRHAWSPGGARLVETGAGWFGRSEGRSLPRARSAGVTRVAVVGESSAALLGMQLRALLERSPCGRRFELLNCALPGAGLEHVERRFDEVMRESPDVVLVTFGHNLRFVFPTDATRLRARQLRGRSRLLTLLGSPLDGPRGGSANAPLAERLPRFERFLRRAARETRARGVAMVVTTMVPNLWMPPSIEAPDRDDEALLDARFAEDTAGEAAAVQRLTAAPEASAWRHFQRGVVQARAGDAAGADATLRRALDLDPFAGRVMGGVNDTIRRVAAEEAALLRDSERAVEALAPQRLPGWESFADNCHLSAQAFAREADAVFELARPRAGVPASCALQPSVAVDRQPPGGELRDFFRQAQSEPPGRAEAWYQAGALGVERRSLVDAAREAREVAAYLQGDPDARALVALAEGSWRAGRPDEALAINARARAGRDAAAWVQLGAFRLRRREDGAAREALQQALAIDPGRADARGYLNRMRAPP